MKEVIKQVEAKYYIAEDGTEFKDRWELERYEFDLELDRLERMADRLRVDLSKHDWPSMTNPNSHHEYKWCKVENREDLELFCTAHEQYRLSLKNVDDVERYVNYPDYICLVDYPSGPEDPDWFTLSRLTEGFNAFMSQFKIKGEVK